MVYFRTAVLVIAGVAAIHAAHARYDDLTDDFSCAADNQAKQEQEFPDWNYDWEAPDNSKQKLALAWEPMLEAVDNCNGLDGDSYKEFSFTVVLDKSWVDFYNNNRRAFRRQGFRTLKASPKMLFNRVSYLYERQFGVRIQISKVVALPNLDMACETNNGDVDDGSFETSTWAQLGDAGVETEEGSAGIIRLGTGDLRDEVYCDSYAPGGAICDKDAITVSQEVAFVNDGSGRLYYESVKTLAHEIAHLFDVCEDTPHCLNGHLQNELPDIMVWDGEAATNARPQGLFNKFLTACTPAYEDTLCRMVKDAPASCGVEVSRRRGAGNGTKTVA